MSIITKIKEALHKGDFLKGMYYYQIKNYEKAFSYLNKFESDGNDKEGFLLKLANCCLELNNYKDGLVYIEEILKINPNNTDCYMIQGDYYLKRNDYASAKEFYEKAKNLNINVDYIKLFIIFCDIELEKYDQAEIELIKIIESHAHLGYAYHLLAQIYYIKKDYEQSLKYNKHAESFHKNDNSIITAAKIHELSGDLHKLLKNKEPSYQSYTKALQAGAKYNSPLSFKIIDHHIDKKDYEKAEELIKTMIKDNNEYKNYKNGEAVF